MQVLEVGVPRALDLLLAAVVVVVVEERAPHQPTAPIKVRVLGAGMPKILHHRLGAVVYHRWMTPIRGSRVLSSGCNSNVLRRALY